MKNIELVLTDMDGTVMLPGSHTISERVRESIASVEEQGVKVVPVTGRPYELAQPAFHALGFDDLCVVDNGASIRHAKTGELAWSRWLEMSTVKKIVEILMPHCVESIDHSSGFEPHIPDKNNEVDRVTGDAPYIFTFLPEDSLEVVAEGLAGIKDLHYHLDRNGYMPERPGEVIKSIGIQIVHNEATKFHGAEALRDLTDSFWNHTLAIGDGDNDLSLFANAGIRVAMGNATEKLRAAADHIVGTVHEDGFAEAMDKYVLRRG